MQKPKKQKNDGQVLPKSQPTSEQIEIEQLKRGIEILRYELLNSARLSDLYESREGFYYKLYKSLMTVVSCGAKSQEWMSGMILKLTKGEEWKPGVKEILKAIEIPVHLN